MNKIAASLIFITLFISTSFSQTKPATENTLNCFNKWSIKFEERGAEDVKDGPYTDVIITFRHQGGKAECFNGKADVIGGKVVKMYLILDDGSYDEVKKVWKKDSEKDVTIVNGISRTMVTVQNILVNVIWPNKIKAKKAKPQKAPEPDEE